MTQLGYGSSGTNWAPKELTPKGAHVYMFVHGLTQLVIC